VASPARLEPRLALAIGVAAVVVIIAGVVLLGAGSQLGASLAPSAAAAASGTSRPTPAVASAPSGSVAPGDSSPSASTGSTAAPGFVLVGAGDVASCSSDGDEATAKLLDGLDGTVFTLGDNAYERGSRDEFRQCYDPSWGRQRARTRPAPGNHEYGTRGAAGYFDYFGAAAGDLGEGWYAYDAGSWRVYVLNSNCAEVGGCDAGSAQERWLHDDLAANPSQCVLAMWHHPLFSSGQHGNNPITRPLWQDLYEAGADLILSGHDHTYERFAPQAPNGSLDSDRGIVEMVVGTGGRSHYPFPVIRDNSLVRDNTTWGVLRLVLSEGSWSFQYLPAPGGAFTDSGGGTCH
jgi:calcineurin-like phosphoesterase family protein